MKLLLINGASGSGKTTLADALSEILRDSFWVHPDGLLANTPRMGADEILEASLSWAATNVQEQLLIVDCQIRPTAMDGILRRHHVDSYETVLLTCPRAVREQRLIDRGWCSDDFERIEKWADILRNEFEEAGHLIFDTDLESVESMCLKLVDRKTK